MTSFNKDATTETRMYWILATDFERAFNEGDQQLLTETVDELEVLVQHADTPEVVERCNALLARAKAGIQRIA